MVTVVEDLLPCTQYSLVIGAGPVTAAQKGDEDTDKEKDETIEETWIFEKEAFKTFASTSSVSQIFERRCVF